MNNAVISTGSRPLHAHSVHGGLFHVFPCLQGDPKQDKELKDATNDIGVHVTQSVEARLAEDTVFARFSESPLVVYKTTKDEFYFGLQVKPSLAAVPARPRDYLVMIDTSASKTGWQLHLAQAARPRRSSTKMGIDDRLAAQTIRLDAPRSLTDNEFKGKTQLGPAAKALAKEYPSGAVNLSTGLKKALGSFGGEAPRQRVLLFLGDGKARPAPSTATAGPRWPTTWSSAKSPSSPCRLAIALNPPTCTASSMRPAARWSASARVTVPKRRSANSSTPWRFPFSIRLLFSCRPRSRRRCRQAAAAARRHCHPRRRQAPGNLPLN